MPKRTRESLNDLLEESDAVASAESVKMTPKEISTISKYCKLAIKCKNLDKGAREKLKDDKKIVKELRKEVLTDIKSAGFEIVVIPTEVRKEADLRAEQLNLPKIPPYVRVTKNAKDLTITTEVLEEVFDTIGEDDILESEEDGTDALIAAIMNGVRRIIRSFNEQVKLTSSLPRGVRAADVEIADPSFAHKAVSLYENSSKILIAEREKRDAIKAAKVELESQKPEVEEVFARARRTFQPITFEGCNYKLFCKTTVNKPKVTMSILQSILHDGVKQCLLQGPSKKLSKQDIANSLKSKKKELLKVVLSRYGTLSSGSKVSIHLQRAKTRSE